MAIGIVGSNNGYSRTASDNRFLKLTGGTINGTLTVNSGSISTSQPLTLTQTWTNAATTYTGLRVNVTDSGPSNAASLLMDLQVGGVSRFNVTKGGNAIIIDSTGTYQVSIAGNTTFSKSSNNKIAFWLTPNPPLLGLASDVFIGWGSTSNTNSTFDLSILRDAANTLAQRNGANAQASRIYGTFTARGAGTTSLEALETKATAAGSFIIQSLKGSAGGTARDIELRHGAVDTNGVITNGTLVATVKSTGLEATNLTASGNISATGVVSAGSMVKFPTYSANSLPNVSGLAGAMIYVSDEFDGPTMAFCDGTDWLRVRDNAPVTPAPPP